MPPLSRPKRTYSAKGNSKRQAKTTGASKAKDNAAVPRARKPKDDKVSRGEKRKRQQEDVFTYHASPSAEENDADQDSDSGIVANDAPESLQGLLDRIHKQASKERARRREKRQKAFDAEVERLRIETDKKVDDGDEARLELCKESKSTVKQFIAKLHKRRDIERKIAKELEIIATLYKQGRSELKTALQGRIDGLEELAQETGMAARKDD